MNRSSVKTLNSNGRQYNKQNMNHSSVKPYSNGIKYNDHNMYLPSVKP